MHGATLRTLPCPLPCPQPPGRLPRVDGVRGPLRVPHTASVIYGAEGNAEPSGRSLALWRGGGTGPWR